MPSPFDFASLGDLKGCLDIAGDDDDVFLGHLISQISRAILAYINRSSILPMPFEDVFDGGGERSVTLREWPVLGIIACRINDVLIPSFVQNAGIWSESVGYIIDPAGSWPPGGMQRLSLRNGRFVCGIQNVMISYTAGYQITDENVTGPKSAPFCVAAAAPLGDWRSDCGVSYIDGTQLTRVASNPLGGQYSVADGTYTFSQADAGVEMQISYGYMPAELAACCMDWAAERYTYRSRIGQQSKSLGGQETIAFIVKDIPDFVRSALVPYRRIVTP